MKALALLGEEPTALQQEALAGAAQGRAEATGAEP